VYNGSYDRSLNNRSAFGKSSRNRFFDAIEFQVDPDRGNLPIPLHVQPIIPE
jgi:hypothetical protein